MMSSEWTIFFHNRCGRYIRLFDDNRRAKREGDTYDHGLVFSDRPLHVGELFQLKIEEIESKWAGSLRIGITTDNPNMPGLKIARAVTDLFTNRDEHYWILSGGHAHNGMKEKTYKLNLHTLNVYDKVAVQVRSDGNLHFYENGFDRGVAMSNIPLDKEIYAVFDLYGRTKQVSWDYFGAPSLEDLCREAIQKHLTEDEINQLSLPPRLKEYLITKAD